MHVAWDYKHGAAAGGSLLEDAGIDRMVLLPAVEVQAADQVWCWNCTTWRAQSEASYSLKVKNTGTSKVWHDILITACLHAHDPTNRHITCRMPDLRLKHMIHCSNQTLNRRPAGAFGVTATAREDMCM